MKSEPQPPPSAASQAVEIACKSGAPVQTRAERPCPIHQDVVFAGGGGGDRLDSIVFRNHYVASISVYQRQLAADGAGPKAPRWVPVLRDERLMAHPHFEDDAQSQRTLYTSRFLPAFDARLCAGGGGEADDGPPPSDGAREPPVGSLRFKLRQPSMMWSSCMELRNLRTYMYQRSWRTRSRRARRRPWPSRRRTSRRRTTRATTATRSGRSARIKIVGVLNIAGRLSSFIPLTFPTSATEGERERSTVYIRWLYVAC